MEENEGDNMTKNPMKIIEGSSQEYWSIEALQKLLGTPEYTQISEFVAKFVLTHKDWTTPDGSELLKKGSTINYDVDGICTDHKIAISLVRYNSVPIKKISDWFGVPLKAAKEYAHYLEGREFILRKYAPKIKKVEVVGEQLIHKKRQIRRTTN